MKCDFHVHTTITDCSETPETVFAMAKKNGVTHLSITDHDTMYGQDSHFELAEKYGLTYIPGIEISAYDYDHNVKCHIVGLYARPGYKPLDDVIKQITTARHNHSSKQVEILKELGYELNETDFLGSGYHGLYKQHIMEALINKGVADSYYGAFYQKMFKKDGPLVMNIDYPSHTEVTKLLADSGAIPVLAHPTLYKNLDAVGKLVEYGLKGIEVAYPSCEEEDKQKIKEIANKYDLFLSGGSDYHGRYAGHSLGEVGSYYVEAFPLLRN